jgi:hypothetical protein
MKQMTIKRTFLLSFFGKYQEDLFTTNNAEKTPAGTDNAVEWFGPCIGASSSIGGEAGLESDYDDHDELVSLDGSDEDGHDQRRRKKYTEFNGVHDIKAVSNLRLG